MKLVRLQRDLSQKFGWCREALGRLEQEIETPNIKVGVSFLRLADYLKLEGAGEDQAAIVLYEQPAIVINSSSPWVASKVQVQNTFLHEAGHLICHLGGIGSLIAFVAAHPNARKQAELWLRKFSDYPPRKKQEEFLCQSLAESFYPVWGP